MYSIDRARQHVFERYVGRDRSHSCHCRDVVSIIICNATRRDTHNLWHWSRRSGARL